MPKWLKITLLVVGLFLLSGLAMCGACSYWAYGAAEEMKAKIPEVMAEAEKDAASLDQQGCLDNALDRAVACEGQGAFEAGKCQNYAKVYARTCFAAASETEGFCEGLPSGDSLMDMAKWGAQRCQDLGREESPSCPQVVQVILEHCGVTWKALQEEGEDAKPAGGTPAGAPPAAPAEGAEAEAAPAEGAEAEAAPPPGDAPDEEDAPE